MYGGKYIGLITLNKLPNTYKLMPPKRFVGQVKEMLTQKPYYSVNEYELHHRLVCAE